MGMCPKVNEMHLFVSLKVLGSNMKDLYGSEMWGVAPSRAELTAFETK
jgi:hypothetical protein